MILQNVDMSKLTIWVLHGYNLLVCIQVVQERSEDPPGGIQLIISDEVGVVALQGIEDKRLVGFRNLEIAESAAVCEIEFSDSSLHAETGQLGVHLYVYRLVGLHANNQLIARNVLEDAAGNVLELDTDFGLLLVEGLASLQDERHAIPSLVLDVDDQGTECGASGVGGDGFVVKISGLGAVQRLGVLPDDNVLGLNGRNASEDSNLVRC